MAAALGAVEAHDSFGTGRRISELMAAAGTADPIDVHLAVLARRTNESILTSDTKDLEELATHAQIRVVSRQILRFLQETSTDTSSPSNDQ